MIQSKSTDYQWNLTDSNSWKEVTVNQSNFTNYFSENCLIWQWKIFFHWWISEKANHWFNQWKFDWFRFREWNVYWSTYKTDTLMICIFHILLTQFIMESNERLLCVFVCLFIEFKIQRKDTGFPRPNGAEYS